MFLWSGAGTDCGNRRYEQRNRQDISMELRVPDELRPGDRSPSTSVQKTRLPEAKSPGEFIDEHRRKIKTASFLLRRYPVLKKILIDFVVSEYRKVAERFLVYSVWSTSDWLVFTLYQPDEDRVWKDVVLIRWIFDLWCNFWRLPEACFKALAFSISAPFRILLMNSCPAVSKIDKD